jgi:predicted RNA-binding protein with TRAM domain
LSEEEAAEGSAQRSGRGPRGGQGKFSQPKPVKEGEEHEVTIETVGRKGDGIAKIQDFVVFVPNTKAGDKVKIRITGIGGSFATGTIVQ